MPPVMPGAAEGGVPLRGLSTHMDTSLGESQGLPQHSAAQWFPQGKGFPQSAGDLASVKGSSGCVLLSPRSVASGFTAALGRRPPQ